MLSAGAHHSHHPVDQKEGKVEKLNQKILKAHFFKVFLRFVGVCFFPEEATSLEIDDSYQAAIYLCVNLTYKLPHFWQEHLKRSTIYYVSTVFENNFIFHSFCYLKII